MFRVQWLASYLKPRTVAVNLGDFFCTLAACGVPQGSILGPLLFSLCMLILFKSIAFHTCYAVMAKSFKKSLV